MENVRGLVSAVGLCALMASPAWGAVALPCFSGFDSDTVGMEPTLGGADNPTGYLMVQGTEAEPVVRASALGLMSQPIEFEMESSAGSGVYLVYDFAPNVTTTLRAEVTFSVSDYVHASVMRTWKGSTGLVLGSVVLEENGDVQGRGGSAGTYTPGVPLRVRMDVDVMSGEYALTVDNELDGFGDDVAVGGLTFPNDPVSDCGGFGIGYRTTSGFELEGVTIAYDDIVIMEIPGAGVLGMLVVSAPVVVRRRR